MKHKINKTCLSLLFLFILGFSTPLICQETVEERLDRLEAKLDSVLALLRTQVELVTKINAVVAYEYHLDGKPILDKKGVEVQRNSPIGVRIIPQLGSD